jgi:hypothetical protein
MSSTGWLRSRIRDFLNWPGEQYIASSRYYCPFLRGRVSPKRKRRIIPLLTPIKDLPRMIPVRLSARLEDFRKCSSNQKIVLPKQKENKNGKYLHKLSQSTACRYNPSSTCMQRHTGQVLSTSQRKAKSWL